MSQAQMLALLFTDLVDSTALWVKHGANFARVKAWHDEAIREIASRWRGVEVKSTGDGFFLIFASVMDALQFAFEAQRSMIKRSEEPRLQIRVGLHVGTPDLIEHEGKRDYQGTPVNLAARVAGLARGDQILLSESARSVAKNELPSGWLLENLGEHPLKGIGLEGLWQLLAPGLPMDFPLLDTSSETRFFLPEIDPLFIGREEAVQRAETLLEEGVRLLTVTGFGGVGKTRFALELAKRWNERSDESAVWVDLQETRSGEEMLRHLAECLHLSVEPGLELSLQIAAVLRRSEHLIVLDNLEQIPDAALLLKPILSDARCRFVFTSRLSLQLKSEREIHLEPLSLEKSKELFIARARLIAPDFEPSEEDEQAIKQLCEHLDRLPLAIELAASRIRILSPSEIKARLGERFDLLQTRSPELPSRQRALRSAIDWSYELLQEEDRRSLLQFSLFEGGFSMEDAEAISESAFVLDSVNELSLHSLLQAQALGRKLARYFLLESVRAYAREKLTPEQRDEGFHRHAQHFLSKARRALKAFRTANEQEALDALELDFQNLRIAFERMDAQKDASTKAELMLCLGSFLSKRSYQKQAQEMIDRGLAIAHDQPDALLGARLLRERASLQLDAWDWQAAKASAERALAVFESQKLPDQQAEAENLIGLSMLGQEQWREAQSWFLKSLARFEEQDLRWGIATAKTNLGVALFHQGALAEVERLWGEASEMRRAIGDQRGLAETLNNLGVLAQTQDRLKQAEGFYRDALTIEIKLKHLLGVARGLSNLGEIAQSEGDTARAIRCFQAATSLYDEANSPMSRQTLQWLREIDSPFSLSLTDLESAFESMRRLSLAELARWTDLGDG